VVVLADEVLGGDRDGPEVDPLARQFEVAGGEGVVPVEVRDELPEDGAGHVDAVPDPPLQPDEGLDEGRVVGVLVQPDELAHRVLDGLQQHEGEREYLGGHVAGDLDEGIGIEVGGPLLEAAAGAVEGNRGRHRGERPEGLVVQRRGHRRHGSAHAVPQEVAVGALRVRERRVDGVVEVSRHVVGEAQARVEAAGLGPVDQVDGEAGLEEAPDDAPVGLEVEDERPVDQGVDDDDRRPVDPLGRRVPVEGESVLAVDGRAFAVADLDRGEAAIGRLRLAGRLEDCPDEPTDRGRRPARSGGHADSLPTPRSAAPTGRRPRDAIGVTYRHSTQSSGGPPGAWPGRLWGHPIRARRLTRRRPRGCRAGGVRAPVRPSGPCRRGSWGVRPRSGSPRGP